MSNENVPVNYTCGDCETIVGDDYNSHPCLEGYNKIYIDDNYYFYPMLNDGVTIVRRSACLDGDEQVVYDAIKNNKCSDSRVCLEQTKKRKKTQLRKQVEKQRKLNDDEVEMLLMEVEQRVPLWNFEIPIENRSKERAADLWQEVSDALNGVISADNAKKKFKSLRDTYRKIIRAEQRSSKSARIDTKELWKFYRCCEYLRD